MVKVLHISTFHLSGGAGLAASRLHRALNKFGLESKLLTGRMSQQEENVFGLDVTITGKTGFWGRFIAERLNFLPREKNREVRYAFSPAAVGKELRSHPLVKEADVIHLHWINFGMLSIRHIRQLLELGKPLVWTLHDMWAFTGGCHYSGSCDGFTRSCGHCPFLKNPSEKDLSFRTLAEKAETWNFHPKTAIVACSQWLEGEARRSSLMARAAVTSIPNPIDISRYHPVEKAIAREKLGLAADKDYILFAAAKITSPLKGFAYLKDALGRLCRAVPDLEDKVELIVIGGGSPEQLEGITLKKHFLGYVSGDENLVNVYSAASLYVTPSVEDNLPNTVMEALACGTPVVGFQTGGIPEMVRHGVNGYVADYKNAASLAAGIQWILGNNGDGELSAAAREKVVREYAEQVVAGRYHELYQSLLTP